MNSKKLIVFLLCLSFLNVMFTACGPTVVVKKPPARRVEVKSAKPFSNAVWIDGHWKWNRSAGKYVWISGHWAKPKPGKTWVSGHWKKTPRGWMWVKGHWR